MPDNLSGSESDQPVSANNPDNKTRKSPHSPISDDALAALERHYGSGQQNAESEGADAASATGFAAMLAKGGGTDGVAESSGTLSALGGAQDASRRDNGELPEAKVIAVHSDEPTAPTGSPPDEAVHTAAEPDNAAPIIYSTTSVEDVDEPAVNLASAMASRPAATRRVVPQRPAGMPEHYKTLIPILVAMGIIAFAIGIWAVVRLVTSHGGGAAGRHTSWTHTVMVLSVLGLPLGLVMLGLTGFVLARYRKKN